MLFLSGLLGLLMAGATAGLMVVSSDNEEDEPPQGDPDGTSMESEGNLLTLVSAGEASPVPVDPPAPGPEDDMTWGDASDDAIAGAAGDDQIDGYGGDDSLLGGSGDDELLGAAGNDTLRGEAGADTLIGGDGADVLAGGADPDFLSGGSGADRLSGEAGGDTLIGGVGDDTLAGGTGGDTLVGADGADTLTGDAGRDELNGNAGNDLLRGVTLQTRDLGAADADTLNGGAGEDVLLGGSGDWLHGGEDPDSFALSDWIDPATPATIADYTAGEDRLAVIYDPQGAALPQISVEPSEVHSGAAWILLDGMRLAEVLDAPELSAQDIALFTPEQFAAQQAVGALK